VGGGGGRVWVLQTPEEGWPKMQFFQMKGNIRGHEGPGVSGGIKKEKVISSVENLFTQPKREKDKGGGGTVGDYKRGTGKEPSSEY